MIDLVRELAEPSRRSILAELKSGPKTVGDLVLATSLKQPNVSNHLGRLRSKGILRANKVGRQVFYSFRDPDVAKAAIGLLAAPVAEHQEIDFGPETTRAYSRAACQGDEETCTAIVDSLIKADHCLVRIYSRLFADSLVMVGQWWSVQAIDEGQEHLASAITERLMARVVHFSPHQHPGSRKAVLGCTEGNLHSIGLRMISDVMKLSGWRTIYLGADVPNSSILSAVRDHAPSAVLLSCTVEGAFDSGLSLIQEVSQLRQGSGMVICTGGHAFSSRYETVRAAGSDYCCHDLNQFVEAVLPMITKEASAPILKSAGA